ncbi:MAG: type II secretion system ATPase GspE [Myxococcota bacterium]
MGIRRESLDTLLLRAGADATKLADARSHAERAGMDLLGGIARTQAVDDAMLAQTLGEMTGLPVLTEVQVEQIDIELVREIPLGLSRDQGILPLWEKDGVIEIALSSPSAIKTLDDLRVLFRKPVRAFLIAPGELKDLTNAAFDAASRSASSVIDEIEEEEGYVADDLQLGEDLLDDPNQAPIIRFVNSLLTQAIKERASDIHIEPFEKELSVRFRIDGVLYEVVKPPRRLQASIVSRVKIMAGLNIAEKRIPQDGRIRTRMAGREIDLRVSSLPVRHGERVVMRILEKGSVFSLDGIGMAQTTLDSFRELIRRPHGIVLVSGPTGSGKTTTLYSALSEINSPDKNILTIEDPVEYELKGIGQTQVNPKIELTFANVLRAHLRQDPDIILVGETRDKITADNAIQASLTGHLVFSTLHTNDSSGAFTRLIDMGVEPFLVSSSLVAILAQRLVRRLCDHCKEAYSPNATETSDFGLKPGGTFYRPVGCDECNNKGYSGRSGIYELLIVDDEVRALVVAGAATGVIKACAIKNGLKTLRDDGIRKALEGVTSLDEVRRVSQEEAAGVE